ncbi:MAG: hypothetical protein R2690_12525 [Acidimicrobiales bacterium]
MSGIDPGWALDILPALVSGVGAGITEVRVQELFNYALYDQPDVVREVIGFGGPMDELPLMLLDFSLDMVWAPMVRILGDLLGLTIDEVTTHVERRPLERTIEVPGMGTFEAGTRGRSASRCGATSATPCRSSSSTSPASTTPARRVAVVGVARWGAQGAAAGASQPRGGGAAPSRAKPGAAGGGNATAANRIVNAIPAVCAAAPGPVHPADLPAITGAAQLRPG